MTVVIDASVAVKWLFTEAGSEAAEGYLIEPLIAPSLFRLECANAVIRRLRRGDIDFDRARFLLTEVEMMPVQLRPVPDGETMQLALALRHPVQDCAHLALARMENLQVVTADQRFVEAAAAAGYGGSVRLLNYP